MSGSMILRLVAIVTVSAAAVLNFVTDGFWAGAPWALAAMYAAEGFLYMLAAEDRP